MEEHNHDFEISPNMEGHLKDFNESDLMEGMKSLTLVDSVNVNQRSNEDWQNVNELDMSSSMLESVPMKIFQLNHLRSLCLSNNYLKTLPEDVRHFKNLLYLDLSHNQFENLPRSLAEVVPLRYLNISNNNFSAVPEPLHNGLHLLRALDISHNTIGSFEDFPGCMDSIRELNVSHNFLETIPEWILSPNCKLEFLDLSYNSLKKLGGNFFYSTKILSYLKVLNLENCKLSEKELVYLISNLRALENLKLGNNDEQNFNYRNNLQNFTLSMLEKSSNLKVLRLNDVGLPLMPTDLSYLKQIVFLDFDKNNLTWLPESFTDLVSLQVCRISSNMLNYLPLCFGKLVNLKELYLENNCVIEIPNSFQYLINLSFIDFYNNKLEYINVDLINLQCLKGIDLENNYLNFPMLCGSSDKFKWFSAKYKILKEHYRDCLNLVRTDCQLVKNFSENMDTDDVPNMSEDEFDRPNKDIMYIDVGTQSENWDEDYPKTDRNLDSKEDDFDPNVNYNFGALSKMKLRNYFCGNFCPGDNHVPSLVNHFLKIKSHNNEDSEEGQYDLD